ncbi:conjugal transfer protein TraD [Novosphingobium sp. PY1]|uniref:conjugal transfer protein TraD n=1 Tax=Novosphingobium sp. PY1 TaxID=1882221 RepID=UPI001A8C066C|nr:conjugal transfer protein TraD [Novosphingobium sp. PY1]GFM31594.1 conjugal transfer protein TraC [Novosphingobium sp. PY1]
MRKPRDYDAELKALNDKARQLKARKQSQLGELVQATGADDLTIEELAGALLAAATAERAAREAWRKRGAAFFRGEREVAGSRFGGEPGSDAKDDGRAQPPAGEAGAA